MINEDKKGLEDVLRHNDAIQRTQEREEVLQHQEEARRKDEIIRKAQEEAEACGCLFFRVISKSQFIIGLFQIILC